MRRFAVPALVAVLTIILYWPVKNFEFINFDDDDYITANRHVLEGLSPKSVKWAFAEFDAANWHPITWISHLLDVSLFGTDSAGPHHLVNVAWHTLNSVLLFLVLFRMTQHFWPSILVAALFAWHPLNVESVAWIAERKNVLSTFFWLLTMLAYLAYARKPNALRYLLVFLSLALGLMSKPMLVTLPFVLLLLDFWPLNRMKFGDVTAPSRKDKLAPSPSPIRRLVLEKIPLLALAIASSVLTVFAQKSGSAVISLELPMIERVKNAFVSYGIYLLKMIWPSNLHIYYPHPYPEKISWLLVLASLLLLAGMTWIALKYYRTLPWLMVGWLWYLGTLVPVIGIVQVGGQARADRYAYVPLIGIFIAIAWSLNALWQKKSALRPMVVPIASVALAGLMFATHHLLPYWRDSIAVFTRSVRLSPRNVIALTNLGAALEVRNRATEAIPHYLKALSYRPHDPEIQYNLAVAYGRVMDFRNAEIHYRKALELNPRYPEAHNNLGILLAESGRVTESIRHYETALSLKPDYSEAHNNLAIELGKTGRREEAVYHFREALRINPHYPQAMSNLGIELVALGKFDEAMKLYEESLKLNSNDAATYNNVALALASQGKLEAAIQNFQRALQLVPSDAVTHYNLAMVYRDTGNLQKSVEHLRHAVELQPNFPQAQQALEQVTMRLQGN